MIDSFSHIPRPYGTNGPFFIFLHKNRGGYFNPYICMMGVNGQVHEMALLITYASIHSESTKQLYRGARYFLFVYTFI